MSQFQLLSSSSSSSSILESLFNCLCNCALWFLFFLPAMPFCCLSCLEWDQPPQAPHPAECSSYPQVLTTQLWQHTVDIGWCWQTQIFPLMMTHDTPGQLKPWSTAMQFHSSPSISQPFFLSLLTKLCWKLDYQSHVGHLSPT